MSRPFSTPLRHSCTSVEHTLNLPGDPRAYGQARGVIPFSCAYFAADASTRGRTSA
jgi:hypothetical protein